MSHSIENLTTLFLKRNKIKLDWKEFKFQIQSHPTFPSLNSVTGVFNHFKIDNVAVQVPVNAEIVKQLPDIYLAQINKNRREELVLVEKHKSGYKLTMMDSKEEVVSENDFLEIFTGIVVAIDEESYKSDDKTTQNSNLNYLLVAVLGLLIVSLSSFNFVNFAFLVTSFIGIGISYVILNQEMGLETKVGNAFCSSTDEKKDCDAVLSSEGAKIFKNFKLSDFSILYFSAQALIIFLSMLSGSSLSLLFATSLVALLSTFYSIYYQYKVVKKWCFLCLCIVGILWTQAILSYFYFSWSISLQSSSIFVLSFLLYLILWGIVKPLTKDYVKAKRDQISYFRFKRNFKLFKTLLNAAPTVDTKIEDAKEIVLGNPNADLEIVIVTNPYCGHCRKVHDLIEDILERHDNLKIITRFNISTEDSDDELFRIITRLNDIYAKLSQKECLSAMKSIYQGTEFKDWIIEWGECKDNTPYLDTLNKQAKWCLDNGINFTPEILVNGKSYPAEYKRSDLLYFIEDLEEEQESNQSNA